MTEFSDEGAGRIADTLLRVNGGVEAVLRMPGPAASGQEAEQFGLATPQFEDFPLGVTLWRGSGVKRELLVGAGAVTALAGVQGFATAEALLETAVGVVVDGVLCALAGCTAVEGGGAACAYRLQVVMPVSW